MVGEFEDQTEITFNDSGDVMYAKLWQDLDDVMSVLQSQRAKHPLYVAFRTVEVVTYSEVATITIRYSFLNFSTNVTDTFVGLVTMEGHENSQ
ncbi:hypothetical protein LIER_34298 [Lithospermum erythrorhizon]|uniref:Uncharacterized protein n=1 Tax=Lithospermum erythrorhizon TaxID=34254 RepID=A0AAV3S288_LITER